VLFPGRGGVVTGFRLKPRGGEEPLVPLVPAAGGDERDPADGERASSSSRSSKASVIAAGLPAVSKGASGWERGIGSREEGGLLGIVTCPLPSAEMAAVSARRWSVIRSSRGLR
jgi:hypothetical protein